MMSIETFSALEKIYTRVSSGYLSWGEACQLLDQKFTSLIYFRDLEWITVRKMNPNLRYMVPESKRDLDYVFLTAVGKECYLAQKELNEREKRDEDRYNTNRKWHILDTAIALAALLMALSTLIVSLDKAAGNVAFKRIEPITQIRYVRNIRYR